MEITVGAEGKSFIPNSSSTLIYTGLVIVSISRAHPVLYSKILYSHTSLGSFFLFLLLLSPFATEPMENRRGPQEGRITSAQLVSTVVEGTESLAAQQFSTLLEQEELKGRIM